MPSIVLLGATGFTGRLIARRLLEGGVTPVLAGRSRASLESLRQELGGTCETATVSLDDPATIARLLGPGDVLVSTVGPFLRLGRPALEAAIGAGAHYLDTTGEAPFVREVFDDHGTRAAAAGCALLPAMGYDFVPGTLAGALALERAGAAATRLDIGYFFTGDPKVALSGGTQASAGGVLTVPGFAFRDGRVVTERCGARIRRYDVVGERRPALTLGSSEVLTLPPLYPQLRDVDVHQGGLGAITPIVAQVGRIAAVPPLARAVAALGARLVKGSTGGPAPDDRARSGTHVVAIASGRDGRPLEEVVLEGPNVYDITAGVVAWAAERCATSGPKGVGALGPLQAFGLGAVRDGLAAAGMSEAGVTPGRTALPTPGR